MNAIYSNEYRAQEQQQATPDHLVFRDGHYVYLHKYEAKLQQKAADDLLWLEVLKMLRARY